MYIISKKKDYYDGVAGTTGIDKTIVYERDIIEVEDKDMPMFFQKKTFFNNFRERENNPFYKLSNSHMDNEYWKKYPYHSYFVIGFCGKLYVGFKLYSIDKNTNDYNNVITKITYDKDFMIKLFEKKTYWGHFQDNLNHVLQYNAMDWFRNMNTPCFVYDQSYGGISHIDLKYSRENHISKFIINPLLSDYEFYKVFDTVQAFQEIQMFIGGVLGNKEKEIINVADKYKIEQHGFDYKWSFRKMPENKK
jgi:hypothetical protein